ncbi:MAG TPA: O-methyltransferase [Cyclobacteriaceae bacterium]|nr:O-methyltransferase [Cyclobacteriaceae bacterium]HMV09894.1 O-methyltransferase [Cyclobacteriaceae bacterium]HMV88720.1 O-methyltransferase [Cyclobacteriaceae bacterium]HMW99632.1 O-methyltransferase [Cyclobacteriaceae bacterium]HMX50991.1 O-methyltransferase [Cyclobacteriaceae bacterium]
MDITNPAIQKYSEDHTSPESELLKKINRDTHANIMMPRMLSGHMQGRILSMISCMIRPSVILEIGTYTGYSALCMAEGLKPEGKLITLDINEELESRVRNYFKNSPFDAQIDYRIGNALDIIPTLNTDFDLVFIDADKENYARYYDLVINRVPLGGYILADNVLWSGKVLDEKSDKDTRAIKEFNKKVQDDTRVENVLLPVRDGILVMRKVRS